MSKREQGLFCRVQNDRDLRTAVEKLRIVEESRAPSASVVDVARRHDVHPNLLTVWRRLARTGVFGPAPALRHEDEVQFAAVSVAAEQSAWRAHAGTGGTIEIAFASGGCDRPFR